MSLSLSSTNPRGRFFSAPAASLALILCVALAGCNRDTNDLGMAPNTPAASAPGGTPAPSRDAGMPPSDGPVQGETGQRSDAVPGDAGSTRPDDAPATGASQPPPGGARGGALQPGSATTPPASGPAPRTPGSGSSSSGPLQPQERQFVAAAYESGRFEAEVARIGAARSRAPAVKSLSATLVAERHTATETLRRIAETRDVPLTDRMTSEMQAQIDSLAGLPVAALDDLLVHSVLIPAHQAGVQRYEAAAESANDPELKDFIERTLPTLKEQLQAVQTLPLPAPPR